MEEFTRKNYEENLFIAQVQGLIDEHAMKVLKSEALKELEEANDLLELCNEILADVQQAFDADPSEKNKKSLELFTKDKDDYLSYIEELKEKLKLEGIKDITEENKFMASIAQKEVLMKRIIDLEKIEPKSSGLPFSKKTVKVQNELGETVEVALEVQEEYEKLVKAYLDNKKLIVSSYELLSDKYEREAPTIEELKEYEEEHDIYEVNKEYDFVEAEIYQELYASDYFRPVSYDSASLRNVENLQSEINEIIKEIEELPVGKNSYLVKYIVNGNEIKRKVHKKQINRFNYLRVKLIAKESELEFINRIDFPKFNKMEYAQKIQYLENILRFYEYAPKLAGKTTTIEVNGSMKVIPLAYENIYKNTFHLINKVKVDTEKNQKLQEKSVNTDLAFTEIVKSYNNINATDTYTYYIKQLLEASKFRSDGKIQVVFENQIYMLNAQEYTDFRFYSHFLEKAKREKEVEAAFNPTFESREEELAYYNKQIEKICSFDSNDKVTYSVYGNEYVVGYEYIEDLIYFSKRQMKLQNELNREERFTKQKDNLNAQTDLRTNIYQELALASERAYSSSEEKITISYNNDDYTILASDYDKIQEMIKQLEELNPNKNIIPVKKSRMAKAKELIKTKIADAKKYVQENLRKVQVGVTVAVAGAVIGLTALGQTKVEQAVPAPTVATSSDATQSDAKETNGNIISRFGMSLSEVLKTIQENAAASLAAQEGLSEPIVNRNPLLLGDNAQPKENSLISKNPELTENYTTLYDGPYVITSITLMSSEGMLIDPFTNANDNDTVLAMLDMGYKIHSYGTVALEALNDYELNGKYTGFFSPEALNKIQEIQKGMGGR